jgi:hypothetical protein
MNYLSPSDYESYGLEATTPLAWVTSASALIDSHCRRTTLAVTQYTERLRITAGRNTAQLSYLPLVPVAPAISPIISARGRYAIPRRGETPFDDLTLNIATAFSLPGTWTDLDPAAIEAYAATGELMLPINPVGLVYSELEVVYTAGFDVLPDAIKVACAQIVRNAQATPALNVRSGHMDRLRLDYFSDSLLDQTVQTLLAPYVAQKVA